MHWPLHASMKSMKIQSPFPLPLSVVFPPPLPPPPPPPTAYYSSPIINYESRISPSILLIIVILAVVFFISGLFHLLVRYLIRPSNRDADDIENVTAMQGQLQQLFHLHDSGVDQSFIDGLPVFLYKAIIGLKDPFDCAVCLAEFEASDKLRLLPKCSHAFHIDCIDTWLLSHSTCPLCRCSLVSDHFSHNNGYNSPVVLVLEAGSESSRESIFNNEIGRDADYNQLSNSAFLTYIEDEEDDSQSRNNIVSQKPAESAHNNITNSCTLVKSEPKVVPVKLGKFRNVSEFGCGEGTSNKNGKLDERRCYSMGSYEYVMNENSSLRVAIKTKKNKKTVIDTKPGHRFAMSECDSQSRRYIFKGFESSRKSTEAKSCDAKLNKKECHSISKIWLRTNRQDRPANEDSSRRASSFRLPLYRSFIDESKSKKVCNSDAASEFNVSTCEKTTSEVEFDVEACNNNRKISSSDEATSFARRTLLWISGRQNRVGNQQ